MNSSVSIPAAGMPSLSIIVPTYREAENLPLLIPQIATALRARGWTWEVIIVDDNSPDATPAVLRDLAIKFPQVRYIIRTTDRGLSSAVCAGLHEARHDYVMVMDADLSHPPESIPALIDELISGKADFVIGSRYVDGGRTESWSRLRWLNSIGATMLAKPIVGAVKDPMAGFFALRRSALLTADPLNPIGYKIGLELIAKCHIDLQRVAEVPIVFRNRVHGESKLTMKEQFRYLEHLSRLYDYKFPLGSPRVKFLIATGASAVACYGTLLTLNAAHVPFFISLAVSLLAMIAVTFAFFARYVRTQRDFLFMSRPYSEFTYISLAEFLSAYFVAATTRCDSDVLRLTIGLAVLVVVRYTLRKVFLHDLRGIRGTPKPASVNTTFSAAIVSAPAASA